MKRLIQFGILFFSAIANAQVTPPAISAFVNSGSGWEPWTAAGNFGQIAVQPPPFALYCQASAGVAWTPCTGAGGGGGTITGSGTANTMTKWTGTTAIGNSSVADDGTKVTVNNPLILSGSTNGELDLTFTNSPAPSPPTNSVQLTVRGAVATPYSVGMPTAQGTGALTNDGSGNLSWTATAGAALVNITSTVTSSGCTVSGNKCVVGSAAPTITFSAIPGTYSNLKIVFSGNTTDGSGSSVAAQFNGDTANHYVWQQLYSFSTSVNGVGSAGAVGHLDIGPVPGGSLTSPGIFELLIPFYAATTFNKVTYSNGTRWDGSGVMIIQNYSAIWESTAAITSIAMFSEGAGNFITGSSFTIYGVQ